MSMKQAACRELGQGQGPRPQAEDWATGRRAVKWVLGPWAVVDLFLQYWTEVT